MSIGGVGLFAKKGQIKKMPKHRVIRLKPNISGIRIGFTGMIISEKMGGEVAGKYWYKKGLFHREGGPAFETFDTTYREKRWYKEGKLHNPYGYAIETSARYKSFCLEDKEVSAIELRMLFDTSLYLGYEIGKYGIKWMKFLTDKNGIEEFPYIKGMEEKEICKGILEELGVVEG